MKRTVYEGVENNLLRKHISVTTVVFILALVFSGIVFSEGVTATDIETGNGNDDQTTRSEKLDILSYCLIFLILALFLIIVIIYIDLKIK